MNHILEKFDTGKWQVVGTFNPSQELLIPGQEIIYLIDNISDFKNIQTLLVDFSGESETRKLETFYSISRNQTTWTDFKSTDSFDDLVNEGDTYYIRLLFRRTGTNPYEKIIINGFTLDGEYLRDTEEFINPAVIILSELNSPIYYTPPNIYKAFKIIDFEIITNDLNNNTKLDIQYRISQDSGKNWSRFEPLTKENISTFKINPLRFFKIEYKLTKIGTDSYSKIKIYDLNLIGEFQNVSLDYYKSNLLGIRDCCTSGFINKEAEWVNGAKSKGIMNTDIDCALPDHLRGIMSDDKKNLLFNPYDIGKAVQLYSGLANISNQVFGHTVEYFLTNPDINGADSVIHEYQLKNVICTGSIKVMVPENNFPDNTISFNQFDLSLFETFEIHITKQVFKEAFGVDKRPTKDDFLYFCQLNRMYQIEHAQAFRDFNNSSIYYKVILRKYSKRANVKAATSTIEDRINELTKNSTLDELLGLETVEETQKVSNKDQHQPLSKDKVRFDIKAKIVKELIENATVIINKYHYDLSNINSDTNAVTYKKVDNAINVSDNRSYYAWFRMNEYIVNDNYNFITNYDTSKNLGYSINLKDDNFSVKLNNKEYLMDISNFIEDNQWYCYLVNIDQRQRKIKQFLYKRPSNGKGRINELELVTSFEQELEIFNYEFSDDIDMNIKGSVMNITNIRVFNEVIPENVHNKTLTENIIRDANYLIMADNANRNIRTTFYEYGTEAPKFPKNNLNNEGFRLP
jgi:hypothetical protein